MPFPSIVITNHDPDYLEMIREVLIDEGYPRVFCASAEEAWPLIQRESPGLVLIDISLDSPHEGWIILDKLRLYAPTAASPVILCATDLRLLKEKAERLAELNCHPLEKPFLIENLLSLVQATLGPPPGPEPSA